MSACPEALIICRLSRKLDFFKTHSPGAWPASQDIAAIPDALIKINDKTYQRFLRVEQSTFFSRLLNYVSLALSIGGRLITVKLLIITLDIER